MADTKPNKPTTSKKPKGAEPKEKDIKAAASKEIVEKEIIQQPLKSEVAEKPQKTEVAAKSKKAIIQIKQIGSPIRRDPRQALYLKSLGLGKINRVRHIVDNASTRGLLDKLRHMVVVVEQ